MLKRLEAGIVEVSDGTKVVKIVNTTPHEIRFTDDSLELDVTIEPSALVNAKAVTSSVESGIPGVLYQTTNFVPDELTEKVLKQFKETHQDVVIIGSLIAAQAYPGVVAAMVAHPTLMRVPPQEKRMLFDRFTIYQK